MNKEENIINKISTIKDLINCIDRYNDHSNITERKNGIFTIHSYNKLLEDVNNLTLKLIKENIKNQHIGILSENSYNWILSFLAITNSNNVAVPIDKELTKQEIYNLLDYADVSMLFFSERFEEESKYYLSKSKKCKKIISLNKEYEEKNIINIGKLINDGKKYDNTDILKENTINPADLCMIVFTSGSTGANKGVMLSHENVTSNVFRAASLFHNKRKTLSILPMNHMFELGCNILPALLLGANIIINDSFKNLKRNLKEFSPEIIVVVPLVIDTFYDEILHKAKVTKKTKKLLFFSAVNGILRKININLGKYLFKDIYSMFGSKLPTIVCGGAQIRTEHVKLLYNLGFDIQIGYGLTEASPVVALNSNIRKNIETVGKPWDYNKVKINNKNNKGIGEIWIKGKNVTKGYYKDEESTKLSFQNDWFKTGDEGRLDSKGNLYVVRRKKNLIILENGKNIYPEEIELLFKSELFYIKEICVFEATKIINDKETKLIAAAIHVMSSHKKDIKNDIEEINKMLTPYKRIQDVFITTEDFDLTGSGKINKAKVIEKYYNNLKED